jgi:hypothetical protein
MWASAQYADAHAHRVTSAQHIQEVASMNRIIWLVGAVVIILFVLGYFGLR